MAIPNEPLTRTEQYLNRTATGGGAIPDEPLTRVEMYLNKIATGDGNVPEVPLTRMEQYLDYIAENGGGGVDPESITLVTLNVSQNGTTNAPTGKAYNKVVANVPNTYAASDEGKVVSNGSLVSQTAHAEVTQNGTIDTTTNNSVTVNVPTPSGTKQISITENGTTTENVAAYANAEITVNVSSGGGVDYLEKAFTGTLTEYINTTFNGESTKNTFQYQGNLERFCVPGLVINTNAYFVNCSSLKYAVISKLKTGYTGQTFQCSYGSALEAVDFTDVTYIINNTFPSDCPSLSKIVLRGSAISTLSAASALDKTPFKSGGAGGTIYIPKALYDHLGDGTSLDYKAATNWSTIDGYGTITWAKIEGSIYETQYADGTPIPTT